jgi:beta-lactamase regulating signal transducer with metallopeptidase domain
MNLVAAWLLNVAMQSVLLLIAACLIDRLFTMRNAWRELLWRAALFGGVFTATLQLASSQAPLAGRWHWKEQTFAPVVATAPLAVTSSDASKAMMPSSKPSPKVQPVVTVVPQQTLRPAWLSLRWLAALWVVGALVMSLRGMIQWLRMRHAFADAVPLDDDELAYETATIADRANTAPPALFVMDALPSPVALHGARIVLPEWALASLDTAHLRAMIAHETAHIARRDPAWKSLIAAWRAIFWFIPSSFAQRRLDDLAELACDAFAAECLGNPRGLAECLAVCAEHHAGVHTFDLAPAMAARKSSLMLRIDRLLEGVTMETTASGTGARVVALLTLTAAALALPAVGIDTSIAYASPANNGVHASAAAALAGSGKGNSSISIHSDSDDGDDSTIVSMSDDQHSFLANIHGKLILNDDESEITGLSEGGTAKLSDTVDGVKQRIELTERGGKLERHYYVGESEHPYDDKARAFMVVVSTELARSGIDAEGRAKRLYAKGGTPRVLDEIDHLHSDYVSGIYLRTLSDIAKLSSTELDRAIAIAGNFSSDYERRQTLTHVFAKQPFDAPHQVAFLHATAKFSSDYDRAETLVGVVPQLADSADVRQAWLDAAHGLTSDYDRRRTYEAMLAHSGMNDRQIATVIEASATMHSDYDRGELLKMAAQRANDGEAIAADYAKSVEGIGSDYNRREALTALMETEHFGPRAASAVLDAAAHVGSDYDRAQLLISLARVMPTDAALVDRYRDIASHLPAHERGEVESALVR